MFVVRRRVRAVCVVILLTVLAALHLHQSADKKADDVGLVSRQKLPSDNGTVYMRGFKGGTGNQIFIFASLYGIARRNKRKPVMLRGCSILHNCFVNVDVECADPKSNVSGTELEERAYGTYDSTFEILPTGDTALTGYYQSWRYFQRYASELRQQLVFRPGYLSRANAFMANVRNGSCPHCGPKTFVGVHVRRGDRVNTRHYRQFYRVASEAYLRKAMDYFRTRHDGVHFIVCSDTIEWCEETLRGQNDVTFSHSRNPVDDLALLSLCNHTVMTVGTFGWWAAWLAGGTTVYYPDHLYESTQMYTDLKGEDYFPPDWIPMRD